jgi:hypothetical protein
LFGCSPPPNVGVLTGPDSGNLGDVDLDCEAAALVAPHVLPPTAAAFGLDGRETHDLYTVADGAAEYLKLQDPVLPGAAATIVELRWPNRDDETGELKAMQTVVPPSVHESQRLREWLRDGPPAEVPGATLVAAVKRVGAAVLVARYAKPKERHALVLLLANLGVRCGWDDELITRFVAAVYAAKKDTDLLARIADGEGQRGVDDARKRVKSSKPMSGLPALKAMLDPGLTDRDATAVVDRVKAWLGVPDRDGPKATSGTGRPEGRGAGGPRYVPVPPYRPFPTDALPAAVRAMAEGVAAAMRCDPAYFAVHALAVCGGMVGATRMIRLKRSWKEPAVVWAVAVGESGTLKTPPYRLAVEPVLAIQAGFFKDHKAKMGQHRAEAREYERAKRKAKDEDPGDPPVPPVCTRVYTRDTTVEALAGLLADSPTRMLIGRDELSGWLASFNQYKAKGGSDQANWLELHGLGTLAVDRKNLCQNLRD